MSGMLRVTIGALLVVAVIALASPAAAQTAAHTPSHVRVVTESARILRWLQPVTDVLLTVKEGTTLEVLDQDADWYWVVVPRSAHGTRMVGWIREVNVEPYTPPAPPKTDPRGEAENLSRVAPPAGVLPTPSPSADDKVTISEGRAGTVSSSTPAGAAKAYTFDDVHFERNRYSLLSGDMETLRAVVTALKADPSLVINIEGHTCNLGTAGYNLALGIRRANAVKDYLASQGIAADRLHTASLGEAEAKYDNTREETRRLNRRVALVPNPGR
jgi:outer membrane protein OmpA-like peptidoglycan-associated protein